MKNFKKNIILFLLPFLLLNGGDANANTEVNRKVVTTLINEVWSAGNLSLVDKLVAENYTILFDPEDPYEGKNLDHHAYKKRVEATRAIFPDIKFSILQIITERNQVAVTWFFTGTYEQKQQVKVHGMTIYTLHEEKVISHWQIIHRY